MKIINRILFLSMLGIALAVPSVSAGTDGVQTYILLYKKWAVPSDTERVIAAAGGKLVYSYGEIGVVIAHSTNTSFADLLRGDSRIEGASATGSFGTQIETELEVGEEVTSNGLSPWGDDLSDQQWDMVQIHVPEAHAITKGSPSVVVGDIDTGIDYTHPDLSPNVDFDKSVSCLGGVPNQDPAAWRDDNGHGTYTAGIIAAAENGIGIVGVAPNVKIAAIKAGNADRYVYPEAVVCAFMWAGSHRMDVTNNSYVSDPWMFNCRNDKEQHVIWKAEQRAIRYAMQQGVTVVAALGNQNLDLSKQTIDTVSPVTREVTNACVVIPVEIPGVIGVTADGAKLQKANYSNYGVGVTQITAPGGDSRFQNPAPGVVPNGRVLSTFLHNSYVYATGTSLASPHVAGVAALVLSRNGKMPPGAVQAAITSTADSMACPPNPFDPGGTGEWLATCVGGAGYNGFYGHGQVNAFNAVAGAHK